MKTLVFFILATILFIGTVHAQIFVSPAGADTNDGSFDHPFLTIPKAILIAVAGDTIYLRGGHYTLSTTIQISTSKNGTAAARYYLFAWPGDTERPLLDFSTQGFGSSNRGISLKASYWYIKGIDIKAAGDNGMLVNGSHNVIEYCTFSENQDTGLQIGGGASWNEVINCDSYFNRDPGQGNADGFSPKLDVGTGNSFYGCRSWQNSDDGWDGYLRPSDSVNTRIENCWSFMNGYLKDGTVGTGNGNGFKMGGGDPVNGISNGDSLRHNMTLIRCLAFDNKVKGFDQNNNRGSMILYNCTAYRNGGNNFSISGPIRSTSTVIVKNGIALGGKVSLGSYAIQATNSWLAPFSVSGADFGSIDTTGVRGPRKADGSLPDVAFMHLAPGSQLIDAGTDVGIPFNGTLPDLGCFETAGVQSVGNTAGIPAGYLLRPNYPNPFNPATTVRFEIRNSGFVSIRVYDVLGREVATLVDGVLSAGIYMVVWDAAGQSSGTYFCRMDAARDRSGSTAYSATMKLLLLR